MVSWCGGWVKSDLIFPHVGSTVQHRVDSGLVLAHHYRALQLLRRGDLGVVACHGKIPVQNDKAGDLLRARYSVIIVIRVHSGLDVRVPHKVLRRVAARRRASAHPEARAGELHEGCGGSGGW